MGGGHRCGEQKRKEWGKMCLMKMQLSKRLGVTHVYDTVMLNKPDHGV